MSAGSLTDRRGEGGALRIVCIADASAGATVVQETLTTLLPRSQVEVADTAVVRDIPDADCVVIDSLVNGESATDVLRRLRVNGYSGSAVLLVDRATPEVVDTATRLGATRLVNRSDVVRDLADAVAAAAQAAGGDATILRALRRTQQLIAAGEIATGLQHALNNPLAALLAEAQLLEMEALDADHGEAVKRIIQHTRRVIEVVRGLEGIDGMRGALVAAEPPSDDAL